MKKLFAFSILSSSIFLSATPLKAEWDHWAVKYFDISDTRGFGIYTVESDTGTETLRTTKCFVDPGINECEAVIGNGSYLDSTTGKLFIENQSGDFHSYDLSSDTWTDEGSAWTSNYLQNGTFKRPSVVGNSDGSVKIEMSGSKIYEKKSDGSIQIGGDTNDIDVVSDGLNIDGAAVITKNTDGSVQIGGDTDDIDVVSDGLNIDGAAVITKNTDGSVQIGADGNDIDVVEDGFNIDGAAVITKNSDGSIQIGADGNDIDITAEGLTVDGVSLITKKDSGEIHIGKNSLITKEEDGVQKLYAKDENDNAIDINVTNGSKLLIDGVEVQTGNNAQVTTNKNNISTNTSNISTNTSNISTNTSNISTNTSNISTNTSNISTNSSNIKNLGEGVAGSTALTAALSALPQTSKESKLSCGVGTGAYSSRYAVGFGCASKVNERVDVNAGGSYVFGGSKSYGGGTLDSGVVKAGFVFKLGEFKKPTQISMKEKENFKNKIESLEEKNKQLLSRLERLEKIALKEIKSKDLAIYKLK